MRLAYKGLILSVLSFTAADNTPLRAQQSGGVGPQACACRSFHGFGLDRVGDGELTPARAPRMRFLNAKWDQSRINRHSFAIRPRAGRNGNIFANRFNRSVLEDDRSVGDHGAMPGGRPPKWAPALLFSRRPAARKVSGMAFNLS